MTGAPLYFDGIDIIRAPGFETSGFSLDSFSSDVTIIHGPNAAGKSTLGRSLQQLLWPDVADVGTSLDGWFSQDGAAWRVKVNAGRGEYQRDGQPANQPNLPPSEQRDRYYLALDRFLQDGNTDASLARTIRRESAGGYDIAAAYDELGYDDSPNSARIQETKDAKKAVKEWREARAELTELEEQQNRLPRLREQREEAKRAKRRLDLLDLAIKYVEAENTVEVKRSVLEEYPDILAEMDGSEAVAVDEFDERIAGWKDQKDGAEGDKAEAESDLAEADLPEEGLPDGHIAALKERQDRLSTLEGKRDDRAANVEAARARRDEALDDSPFDVDGEALTDLKPVVWREISEFLREASSVQADRDALEAVETWLGGDEQPETDESALQRGRQALENWLAESPGDSGKLARFAFRVALVAGLAVGGIGIMVGVYFDPVFLLALIAAGWLLWYAYKAYDELANLEQARETYRSTFERLGLDPPTEWSEEAVSERLREIYDGLAENRLAEQRAERREALEPDEEKLETRKRSLEDERAELRDQFGIELNASDVELGGFLQGLKRWQDANGRVVELEAEIEEVEGQIESVCEKLEDGLSPYGYDAVEDAPAANGYIVDLEKRKSVHERASETLNGAKETIDRAEAKIEELEGAREAVFDDLGLDADEDRRLRELCNQMPEYSSAEDDLKRAKTLAEGAEKRLKEHPDFDPDIQEYTVPDLKEERRDARETAGSYDDLDEEIRDIEGEIRRAKKRTDIEDAVAKKARSFDDLADKLDEDYGSMVGHVLVEHIREASSKMSQPEVLKGAREIFATITKGRYRLEVDAREESFRAVDTVEERGHGLDELSSGTRLQLLFSVRVAFVERQESGAKLPLILDEALANTDDRKAEIVIDSMIELAREGRQVIYLSAQGDEVAKWLRALEGTDRVDHEVIDLAEERDLDRHVAVPDLDELAGGPASPPDPSGHDHGSFGEELDVPPVDPRRGAGHVHLWYLVDDLDLLCRLLELGIERWGQLRTLRERSGDAAIVDDPERLERVEQAGAALEEFIKCWQTGRGPPVTIEVLEESGAITDTFIDEVSELARTLDGDGAALVEALRDGRVKRFRGGKADDLEAYLEETGYIQAVDTLDPEQIRARVAAAYHQHDVDREQAAERASELLSRVAQP